MSHGKKQEFRDELGARVKRMPPDQMHSESIQLCDQVRSFPRWKDAESVLLFHSLPDEPDIRPLLSEALADGRRLFLPRFNSEKWSYQIVEVRSLDSDLNPGKFGILEPTSQCNPIQGNHLDFIGVPGLGFDVAGRRLGRGMGYYDRILSDLKGSRCGLSFDCQLCVEIPEEPHDWKMNWILTPTRCIEVQ